MVRMAAEKMAMGGEKEGEGIDHLIDIPGKDPALAEFIRQVGHLAIGGYFACEQEKIESLHIRHLCTWRFGQFFEYFRKCITPVPDPLLGIQIRDIGHKAFHPPHAANGLSNGDLAHNNITIVFE
jgi:hypothetical protein